MGKPLLPVLISLALAGCTVDLPEISPHHPASREAPAGTVYTTPAVLEVQPLADPPDRPMTRPAHPYSHESEGMTPMGEMPDEHEAMPHPHEGQMIDPTATLPAPVENDRQPDHREGKGQQHLQREGQLHD